MKYSPILDTTLRWLLVLLGIVSFFLLLRGHDETGGGFSGGLVAATAVIIMTITYGAETGRKLLHFQPLSYISIGLIIAVLAGVFNMQVAFMRSVWVEVPLGFTTLKLGTPLLFDMGVYILVLGVVSSFVLELESALKHSEAEEKGEG
ncbi:MAG: Na(+)/H(+) antiporter subunit B [Methyloprofundus sp.]|nr:Na(+)/H(+) antiporter subunit B [Methyloprofundus sp.]